MSVSDSVWASISQRLHLTGDNPAEVDSRDDIKRYPEAGDEKVDTGADTGADTATEATAGAQRPPLKRPQALRRRSVMIGDQRLWVVEGDLLLDDEELSAYDREHQPRQHGAGAWRPASSGPLAGQLSLSTNAALMPSGTTITAEPAGLVAIATGGRVVRWAPGTVLTYAVLRRTFPDSSAYQTVVAAMEQATRDWMSTCGITWAHRSDLDDDQGLRPPVVFTVRYLDVQGKFIAAAFFPNDPVDRRRVFIDPTFFTTRFERAGVLRHELGHVMGFRHEHIRSGAPAICPDEDTTGTFDLTAYDPQSVMHYFCGGGGRRDLRISEVDRVGSQLVYGPPLEAFEFCVP